MSLGISQFFGNSFYRGIEVVANFVSDIVETVCDCCSSCFNDCRKACKEVSNGQELDIDLDEEITKRGSEALQQAKTRNGAKTNEEIARYHETIEHKRGKDNGIFQYSEASHDEERKLVILLMGNLQSHSDSHEEVGLLKIYDDLKKEDRHDVLLCRVGSCMSDINSTLGLSDDDSLNTDVVYEHISNLIEDRCHCNGKFQDSRSPTSIDVVGYSWGGGVQKKLEERWHKISNGKADVRTACIDGIEYGCRNLGDELTSRPQYSTQHLNIYQNNSWLLNGEKHNDPIGGDHFVDVDTIDRSEPGHNAIDDSKPVQARVKAFLAKTS